MRNSWRVGRILGIEIRIDTSWLIIFSLIAWSLSSFFFPNQYPGWSRWVYWVTGIATALVFFGSVLAHELSHSLVAMKQGERVENITLFMFGGAAQIADEPHSPGDEFRMAVAGPLASLVLATL